jgi:hypothetical protein
MPTTLALLLSLLSAAIADVPMAPFPDCDLDVDEDLCPSDLNEWWLISGVPEQARATVREEELSVGSGCHADEAWRTTPGRWDVMVAVLDSGISWDRDDLVYKIFVNSGELPLPQDAEGVEADSYDLDGNGLVNLADWADDPRLRVDAGRDDADDMLDPSDLLGTAWGEDWDGVDNDGNGYTDDIAGWDFMAHDNDAYNDYERDSYGTHGSGVMEDIGAEGDGGGGDIGVCPNCAILPVRVGHAFISDAARVGQAIVFAVDSGASVINMSIGALSHSQAVDQALAYAHERGVVISAAAGDENAYHQNYPAMSPNVLYAHSIRSDIMDENGPTYSYQSFFNCNNYGPRSVISATGQGCATAATAMTSGAAGLILSAGRDEGLELSASEVYQLVVGAADDIHLSEEDLAITGTYPSSEGWDPFYGYGKLNAGRAVQRVLSGEIPPEIEITGPAWFHLVDPAQQPTITVTGRLAAQRASSFDWSVELGWGWEPETWIELAQGSSSAVIEGELATVDLSVLPDEVGALIPGPPMDEGVLERVERVHASTLTARVTVTDDRGLQAVMRRSFHLQEDPDLLPGFPVDIASSAEASPVLADLDGDGLLEIVLADAGGWIHALRGDGSELEGYPLQSAPPAVMEDYGASPGYLDGAVDPDAGDGFIAAAAVGDLDGDGRPEVVGATMSGALYAWSDGALREGFPVFTIGREPQEFDGDDVWDQGFWSAPTLVDLDGDGASEIIAAAMDGRVYVVDHSGADWGPYPLELCHPENCGEVGAPIVSSPAVGDVDGDGDLDIALGHNETTDDARFSVSYLLDANTGTPLSGWPRETQGLVGEASLIPIVGEGHPSSLSLADVDGDGDLELADTAFLAHTQLIHHDGEELFELAHFADQYGEDANTNEPSMVHFAEHPAFGDLTGDGVPDLVQGGVGTMYLVALPMVFHKEFQHPVAAWDGTSGGFLPGWPQQLEDLQFFMAPAIADISGDGRPEAIITSGGYMVHAWDAQGLAPQGWPKLIGQWAIGSPAVGDLDGDGYLEVVVASRAGQVFAWSTRGPADGAVEWASVHHDAAHTGNYHSPLPAQAGPPAEDPPECTECCCRSGIGPRQGWLWLLPAGLLWLRRRGQGCVKQYLHIL